MSAISLRQTRPGSGGLWFGLVAAPSAWILQGLLGWWLGAGICGSWSVGWVRTRLVIVGFLALVMALTGVISSLNRWRLEGRAVSTFEQPRDFFVFGGIFVSSAFAVGIVWATLNPLLVTACGATR